MDPPEEPSPLYSTFASKYNIINSLIIPDLRPYFVHAHRLGFLRLLGRASGAEISNKRILFYKRENHESYVYFIYFCKGHYDFGIRICLFIYCLYMLGFLLLNEGHHGFLGL